MRRRTLIAWGVALSTAVASTAAASYWRLFVANETSPSGIFDPSLVLPAGSAGGYMAYSGVNYHVANGNLVKGVSTRIAYTTNSGVSWTKAVDANYMAGAAVPNTNGLCGPNPAQYCSGYEISEVPFLVDDPTDPNPNRRFKLFTHRYFLYPPKWSTGEDTHPELGTIRLETAADPAHFGGTNYDYVQFKWNATPWTLAGGGANVVNVNQLPGLQDCLLLTEGSGKSVAGQLYLAFACPIGDLTQKIVMIRSFDHGTSWHYVATPLSVADANRFGFFSFTAPDLFLEDGAAWLWATPLLPDGRGYRGCVLFRFADLGAGTLVRDASGTPVPYAAIPTEGDRFGGACSSDSGSVLGAFMIQLHDKAEDGYPSDPFRIVMTGVSP